MIHMNEIDLYWEPRNKILPLLPEVNGEPEMSSFDSAFLCGAIRKFMPNKIVEVGIAGGGVLQRLFCNAFICWGLIHVVYILLIIRINFIEIMLSAQDTWDLLL